MAAMVGVVLRCCLVTSVSPAEGGVSSLLHSVAPGAAPSPVRGESASAADEQRRATESLQSTGLTGVGTAEQEQRPHSGS